MKRRLLLRNISVYSSYRKLYYVRFPFYMFGRFYGKYFYILYNISNKQIKKSSTTNIIERKRE